MRLAHLARQQTLPFVHHRAHPLNGNPFVYRGACTLILFGYGQDGLGQVQVLPEDCLLYICECGVITRKDMKTLRLCSSHLRDVVNRLFFRSAVIVRTTETLTSANPLAKSMVLHHTHICARLTTLTIYGASSWGMLKVTTSQLWVILTTARAVSTVVLASVYISGPPHSQAVLTPRKALMRVSLLDADFAATSTFVQAMVAIGSIEWLHLEHITFSRGIHFGVGSLGADELHCRAWVPTAARVSFCSFSWSTAGIFTSTFTPCDGRAKDVKELDISFHSLANANNAVPLLKACSNLHTLRVHFYSPSQHSVHCRVPQTILRDFTDNNSSRLFCSEQILRQSSPLHYQHS